MSWAAFGALSFMVAGGLTGCTSRIPIEERGVFQAKRTLDAHTFDFDNASYEEVPFTADDGTALYAWHIRRTPSTHTVIYFGGQGFHLVLAYDFVAQMLAHVPVDLFVVDYRGYGRSDGEPSVTALKADALRAFTVLTEERGVAPDRVVVHGHSMGSFIASHVAHERKTAGLVLESALTDVEDWTEALVPDLLEWFLEFDIAAPLLAESNLRRVKGIEAPSLFVVGTKDPITPPILTEALHEASVAPHKRMVQIEGGDHNGLEQDPVFVEAYAAFVESL